MDPKRKLHTRPDFSLGDFAVVDFFVRWKVERQEEACSLGHPAHQARKHLPVAGSRALVKHSVGPVLYTTSWFVTSSSARSVVWPLPRSVPPDETGRQTSRSSSRSQSGRAASGIIPEDPETRAVLGSWHAVWQVGLLASGQGRVGTKPRTGGRAGQRAGWKAGPRSRASGMGDGCAREQGQRRKNIIFLFIPRVTFILGQQPIIAVCSKPADYFVSSLRSVARRTGTKTDSRRADNDVSITKTYRSSITSRSHRRGKGKAGLVKVGGRRGVARSRRDPEVQWKGPPNTHTHNRALRDETGRDGTGPALRRSCEDSSSVERSGSVRKNWERRRHRVREKERSGRWIADAVKEGKGRIFNRSKKGSKLREDVGGRKCVLV
ncbi:unnamed protein product [Calypogeia fissa]